MNSQQFGVTGLSLGHAHPALSQAAPTTLPGEAGDQPPWGQFSLLGFVSPWLPAVQQLLVAPQAALTTRSQGEAASLHPSGCSLITNPSCWSAHSRDSVMEVFSAITPSCICWGPLSASSTAPCGQNLLGLLCPSALIFYLDLSYYNPSCAWLGCPQPSPDAVFQDGRFPQGKGYCLPCSLSSPRGLHSCFTCSSSRMGSEQLLKVL